MLAQKVSVILLSAAVIGPGGDIGLVFALDRDLRQMFPRCFELLLHLRYSRLHKNLQSPEFRELFVPYKCFLSWKGGVGASTSALP